MKENYSDDKNTKENINSADKYSLTGESEYSRLTTLSPELLVDDEEEVDLIDKEDSLNKKTNSRSHKELEGRVLGSFRISDETLLGDIQESLFRNKVDSSSIAIVVEKGDVFVSGEISPKLFDQVSEVLSDLQGVKSVNYGKGIAH